MKPEQNAYPVFEANQVLTSQHLNDLFHYLNEQERLTRANLIGIGIVCGLEARWEGATIHLTNGCGITSVGHLIVQPENVTLGFSRTYTLPDAFRYPPFLRDDEAKTQRDLWELLPTNEAGSTSLTEIFLNDKVVVLLLELKEESLRNCSPNNCDDKGAKVTPTIRPLLIRKEDVTDPLADLTALPDLRLPRYDVPDNPVSNPTTTEEVLNGFLTALQKGNLVGNTRAALQSAYTAFQTILPALEPLPLVDFQGKFETPLQPGGALTAAQRLFLQYYYDFFDDLLQAYDELRQVGDDLRCACCASADLFPQHLLLGDGTFTAGSPAYRQRFLASPAVSDCEKLTRDVQQLFRRLGEMIKQFQALLEANAEIRLTPSHLADVPLSAKCIPYYYSGAGDPPLYRVWSPEKTRRKRENQNLSYRANTYFPPAPPFVTDPLSYDLEPYNFLRVEGHLGKPYQDALARLRALKAQYRLPLEIVTLRTGSDTGQPGDNSLQRFLAQHPGLQHKAGAPLQGTLVLVYHGSAGAGIVPADRIIADFFLPYPVRESDCRCQVLVRECEYEWIDSIRHLNNLSLRDYRFQATAKAPAAREEERDRLRDRYVIRIYKYEIQGSSLLPGNQAIDIEVPLTEFRQTRLSAVARKLNERFPLGLVFDYKPGSNKLLIRRLEGQQFRLELGGIQGNQIRYAYENDRIYRWQHKAWEALDQVSNFGVVCRVFGGDYQAAEYEWLHQHHPPRYPAPPRNPTAQEAIEWEKLTLARARRYKEVRALPIYDEVLNPIENEIRRIIDLGEWVVLIGSWANGSWVSRDPNINARSFPNREQWTRFQELREKVTGKTGHSDIDLLIDSVHEVTPDMLRVPFGYRVNILKGKADAQKGLFLVRGDEI